MSMKEKDLVADAIKFWMEKAHINQSELAMGIEVEPATVSQYVTKRRAPSLEMSLKMAEYFGVSLPEFFSCKDDLTPEIVFVERVKARPRAGTGGLETDGETTGLYSFHKSFLARKRGKPETMKIFEVSGDSMEPTLADGDLIMINQADKDVRTGHIYLLRLGAGENDSELMVKRLERRPGGVLLIRSDNPRYEDIPVDMNTVDGEIEIFGRMVWSCREY